METKANNMVICARIPMSVFKIVQEKSRKYDISVGAVIRECIIHSLELSNQERLKMSNYRAKKGYVYGDSQSR